MVAAQSATIKRRHILGLAAWLAIGIALLYILSATDSRYGGELQVTMEGGTIVYITISCYLLGGLLLLVHHWAGIVDVIIKFLVRLFSYEMDQDRPPLCFPIGGLTSTTAQLWLEMGLVALTVNDWQHTRRPVD